MNENATAEAEKKTADDLAKKVAFEKVQDQLKEKSTADLISIINDVRTEARDRRYEKNGLEEELVKMKTEQKAKVDAKLVEEGKLQELIDSQLKELSDKGIELDTLKVKADEFTEFKASKIEDAKKKLGEHWNEEYANLSLSAIDNLVKTMVDKPSPAGDNGATGEATKMKLTDEQKVEAYRRYPNISPERAEDFYKHNLIKQKERLEKK